MWHEFAVLKRFALENARHAWVDDKFVTGDYISRLRLRE